MFCSVPPSPEPQSLSQRLTLILRTLRAIIAARAGRDRSKAPVVLLLWPYLHRAARRFEALTKRVQAGDVAAAPTRPRPASVAPRVRPPRLPRGFAWLIRLAPDAAPLGGQLRHLLVDPEFAALLAADPRAGKILRPLCRMLGVRPDPDLPPALFRPRSPAPETLAMRLPSPEWPPTGSSPTVRDQPGPSLFRAAPA